MYSWQSFRNRLRLIGLKWPWERTSADYDSSTAEAIDLIQWIVFCRDEHILVAATRVHAATLDLTAPPRR